MATNYWEEFTHCLNKNSKPACTVGGTALMFGEYTSQKFIVA
jgi:hypothetical protein